MTPRPAKTPNGIAWCDPDPKQTEPAFQPYAVCGDIPDPIARALNGLLDEVTSLKARITELEQEGVLIDNFLLVSAGRFREAEFRTLLATGPYPVRNAEQNLGDIKAQVAACARGATELKRLMSVFGRGSML